MARGERFKRRLPPFVGRISDMSDLLIAEDREFDRIDDYLSSFAYGLYVSTAKDSNNPDAVLRRLELDYGLPHTGTVEERIARILAKMQGTRTTTEQAVIDICKAYGLEAEFIEMYRQYAFRVDLISDKLAMLSKYRDVRKSIEEVKPAHLHLLMRLIGRIKTELWTAAHGRKYLYIQMYSYREKAIEATQRLYMGGGYPHVYTITIKDGTAYDLDDSGAVIEIERGNL